MVKRFFWISIVFSLIFIFSVDGVSAAGEAYFNIKTDYRTDGLSWNIAGNLDGEDPNILSELTWKELQICQLVAEIKLDLNQKLTFQSSLGYGLIGRGYSQDSDYYGNDRTMEFSRSNNQSNGDNVWDGSISIGYRMINNPKWDLILSAGYSWNRQNLRMTDGYQTIPDTGAFTGLNSTYKSSWNGPLVGVYAANQFRPNWHLFGNVEYHWADYYGEGNWNLRDDLLHPVSFIHQADGGGVVTIIGVEYSIPDEWSVDLSYKQANWAAGNGLDQVFSADGLIGYTRLNEVVWNSSVITFIVRRFF